MIEFFKTFSDGNDLDFLNQGLNISSEDTANVSYF